MQDMKFRLIAAIGMLVFGIFGFNSNAAVSIFFIIFSLGTFLLVYTDYKDDHKKTKL